VSRRVELMQREHASADAAPAPILRVSRVGKQYSSQGTAALAEVTFDVAGGEVLAVVGPSGCGKTTLLRILCGLTSPSGGVVLFDGRPVLRPPREVALVFQDYTRSLFPWLSVIGNVTFPLRGMGLSRADRVARAQAVLKELGLESVERRYPWELSGGMQQRVAIARAIVSRPQILLLDEPFASVDALTRAELQDVLLRVHDDFAHRRVTILHVTHDIDEAVYLADRALVLASAPGRVVASIDVGLSRPRVQVATRSSAEFLAVRNEIHAVITSQHSIRSLPSPKE
jgi:NitT/TauT family transport system ATP-binding protein